MILESLQIPEWQSEDFRKPVPPQSNKSSNKNFKNKHFQSSAD